MVRRAVLRTAAKVESEVTDNHINILGKCPLIEDIKIHGYSGYLVWGYRHVLPQLHLLRTLCIFGRSSTFDYTTDYNGATWWSEILQDHCNGRGITLVITNEIELLVARKTVV